MRSRDLSKILLIMRLTVLLLITAILQVSADSFAQKLTLSEKNAPLINVFEKIRSQSGFDFMFSLTTLEDAKKVNITIKDAELTEVLKLVFEGQPLDYIINNKSVVVSKKKRTMMDRIVAVLTPPINVKGRVVDSLGRPLSGASIKVKGLKLATSTNYNGEFTLNGVEDDAVLVVSFIGFESINISAHLDLGKIVLKASLGELEEVEISTGYQTFNPERFVGSASKLDSADFHRQTGVGILERLKGTLTGLQFGKESNTNIQQYPMIRGVSTLSTTEARFPLIVVDNFPMDERFDLNSINPNDVQDITVLKDAAAASIWGSASGNGVIVITTKKGKFNQAFKVAANSNIGITEKPDLYYYPRMSIEETIDVERFLFEKGYYDANLNNSTTRPFISPVVELLNQMTDANAASINQEIEALSKHDIRHDLDQYLYRKAIKQQHHLSMNGGNNFGAYSFSAGYNRDLSNLQNNKASDQFTIRSQNSFRPAKYLMVEAGIMLSKSRNRDANFPTLPQIPYMQLADEKGNALPTGKQRLSYLETLNNGKLLDWNYRPLDEIRLSDNEQNDNFVNLNLATTVQFLPWLKGTARFQHRQNTSSRNDYFSEETYFTRDLVNRFSQYDGDGVKYIIPLAGILDVGSTEMQSTNFRGQFDFNQTWLGKHSLSGILASDISRATTPFKTANRFYGYDINRETYATGLDYSTKYPMIDRIAGTTAQITGGTSVGSGVTNNRVSFLGNASYTYNNRITLYGSARRDGANVFGVHTNNKWKPLWSAGGSWDITKENFFQVPWISYLRLRSSYGYMGNTTGGTGLTTMLYQRSAITFTNFTQATLNNPPNPHLRWEEVRTINFGLDFDMFKGRLTGSIEGFQKRSKDIVSSVPSDPTLGVNSMIVNSASLKGNGVELKLTSQNLRGPLSWTTNFGYSYVKTIVTELYNGKFKASDFITHNLNSAIDRVVYGLSSYRWAGLDPENGDPRGYLNGEISKDYRGIGNDEVDNQIFNGSSLPMHFGFIGNVFNYKRITLSANINFNFDYYFRKPTLDYSSLFSQGTGHVDYQKHWREKGDEVHTTVPSMVYPNTIPDRDLFYQYSEIHVLRGDHIRLRDFRLQYQLNRQVVKALPVQNISLFIYANNLNIMLWRANNSDLDPDFLGFSNYTSSPSPRSWSLGLNLTL